MEFTIEGEKKFFATINFYKKRENWLDILRAAAETVSEDIEDDAKGMAYSHFKRHKGELEKSIMADAWVDGDLVYLSISSDHPAAAIIEYGGYSPMPVEFAPYVGATYSDRLLESARLYGKDPYVVARGIEKNQPFTEPHPFMRPAMQRGTAALEKEIHREAKRQKP